MVVAPKDESNNAVNGFKLELYAGSTKLKTTPISDSVTTLFYQENDNAGNLVGGASLTVVVVDTSETYLNSSFTFTYSTNMTKTITLKLYYKATVTVRTQGTSSPL